jgi:hypothetical protein
VSADILTTVMYKQQDLWVPTYWLLCCTNSKTCECRHTDYFAVQTSRTCECRHTDYCAVQTTRPVSADILFTVLYKQQDLWVPTYWLLCCTNKQDLWLPTYWLLCCTNKQDMWLPTYWLLWSTNSRNCDCRHTDYCVVQTAGPVTADILTTVLYKQQDQWILVRVLKLLHHCES